MNTSEYTRIACHEYFMSARVCSQIFNPNDEWCWWCMWNIRICERTYAPIMKMQEEDRPLQDDVNHAMEIGATRSDTHLIYAKSSSVAAAAARGDFHLCRSRANKLTSSEIGARSSSGKIMPGVCKGLRLTSPFTIHHHLSLAYASLTHITIFIFHALIADIVHCVDWCSAPVKIMTEVCINRLFMNTTHEKVFSTVAVTHTVEAMRIANRVKKWIENGILPLFDDTFSVSVMGAYIIISKSYINL